MFRVLGRITFLVLLLLVACSHATLVVVTVTGVTTGFNVAGDPIRLSINALPILDGVTGTLERYPAGTTDFGLLMPNGAMGNLQVFVAGLNDSSCIVTGGIASTTLSGQGQIDVTADLTSLLVSCTGYNCPANSTCSTNGTKTCNCVTEYSAVNCATNAACNGSYPGSTWWCKSNQ